MKKIITLAVLLAIFVACSKDFLDKGRLGQDTPDLLFSTKEGVEKAMAGAYNPLMHYESSRSRGEIDVASDDAIVVSQDEGGWNNLCFYENLFNSPISNYIWNSSYRGISRANEIINNLEAGDNPINDATYKREKIAEAKCLRAYYYFNLVRAFGGVPVYTTISPSEFNKLPRNTRDETYEQVERDALDALNTEEFPETDVKREGRLSKRTARGLLVKAYAQWAGKYDENGNVSQYSALWEKAKEIAEPLKELPLWSGEDYENLFRKKGENSDETILEVQYMLDGPHDQYGNGALFLQMCGHAGGKAVFHPTKDLFETFEEGDKRRELTLATADSIFDWELERFEETPSTYINQETGYMFIKAYRKPSDSERQTFGNSTDWRYSGYNDRTIRLTDIYLLYAEACARTDDEDKARTYLNKVRKRAREYAISKGEANSVLPDVSSSGQELIEAILHERRVELAGEGHRWYDLVRTGKLKEVMENGYEAPWPEYENFFKDSQGNSVSPPVGTVKIESFNIKKFHVLPLPIRDVENSFGILEQNFGY